MAKKIQVEIWSDVVCPFCYLGKRKFELALEKFPQSNDVEVIWKSYQLNPFADTENVRPVNDYLMTERGMSAQQIQESNGYLEAEANKVGLEYHMDSVKMTNTLNAHQLLHYAKVNGKANEAEELLFKSVFTYGKDVNDDEVLADVAEDLGLDRTDFANALKENKMLENVEEDKYEAQQFGIRSVPYFVFNRKYAVSGAQEPESFGEVLEKVYSEIVPKPPFDELKSGESCDTDGNC